MKPKALPTILTKNKTRLRVKEISLPIAHSNILGDGIDVTALPEGHFACNICHGYKFECSIMGDFHRLEVGCMECGKAYRFLFPLDCPLPPQQGRFTCFKHKNKGMIIIHNIDCLCVGCEFCKTQIVFKVKTNTNIIVPENVN